MAEQSEVSEQPTNRVREFRTKRGLKQGDLAREARLSQPAISQIEHGRSTSKATQERLAAALGVKQIKTLFPRQAKQQA